MRGGLLLGVLGEAGSPVALAESGLADDDLCEEIVNGFAGLLRRGQAQSAPQGAYRLEGIALVQYVQCGAVWVLAAALPGESPWALEVALGHACDCLLAVCEAKVTAKRLDKHVDLLELALVRILVTGKDALALVRPALAAAAEGQATAAPGSPRAQPHAEEAPLSAPAIDETALSLAWRAGERRLLQEASARRELLELDGELQLPAAGCFELERQLAVASLPTKKANKQRKELRKCLKKEAAAYYDRVWLEDFAAFEAPSMAPGGSGEEDLFAAQAASPPAQRQQEQEDDEEEEEEDLFAAIAAPGNANGPFAATPVAGESQGNQEGAAQQKSYEGEDFFADFADPFAAQDERGGDDPWGAEDAEQQALTEALDGAAPDSPRERGGSADGLAAPEEDDPLTGLGGENAAELIASPESTTSSGPRSAPPSPPCVPPPMPPPPPPQPSDILLEEEVLLRLRRDSGMLFESMVRGKVFAQSGRPIALKLAPRHPGGALAVKVNPACAARIGVKEAAGGSCTELVVTAGPPAGNIALFRLVLGPELATAQARPRLEQASVEWRDGTASVELRVAGFRGLWAAPDPLELVARLPAALAALVKSSATLVGSWDGARLVCPAEAHADGTASISAKLELRDDTAHGASPVACEARCTVQPTASGSLALAVECDQLVEARARAVVVWVLAD